MSTATASPATTVQAVEAAHVLQTYKRQPVVFVRGEGVWLVADDGKRYLDMLSGIGVNVLGHAHPALVAAVREQVGELVHTSNLFFHPYQGPLAERLTAASGLERAFFCNSGAEAVEGCLKFARRFWYTAGTPRTQFIAFERGFSGRTMGALSTTWDEHYRVPFGPLVPEVRFVSNEDPADLLSAVSDNTAAIIAEPIQGEGGVRPLPPADRRGDQQGLRPDRRALHRRRSAVGPRAHRPPVRVRGAGAVPRPDLGGQGARRLACRSARCWCRRAWRPASARATTARRTAAIRWPAVPRSRCWTRSSDGLLDHVRRVGPVFADGLRALAQKHPMVVEVRGAGLMQGLVLDRDAAPVVPAALERGLIVNRTAERVVRLLPPYVITEAEIAEALSRLDAALSAVEGA